MLSNAAKKQQNPNIPIIKYLIDLFIITLTSTTFNAHITLITPYFYWLAKMYPFVTFKTLHTAHTTLFLMVPVYVPKTTTEACCKMLTFALFCFTLGAYYNCLYWHTHSLKRLVVEDVLRSTIFCRQHSVERLQGRSNSGAALTTSG